MQVIIRADEGDQLIVTSDGVTIEQSVVRLDINSSNFRDEGGDWVTLTVPRARELAMALLNACHTIDRDDVLWS